MEHHQQANIWTFTPPCLQSRTPPVKHALQSEVRLINARFKAQRVIQHHDSVFKRRLKAALAAASFRFVLPSAGGQTGRLLVYRPPPASTLLSPSLSLLSPSMSGGTRWFTDGRSCCRWVICSVFDPGRCCAVRRLEPRLSVRGALRRRKATALGGGRRGACTTPSR